LLTENSLLKFNFAINHQDERGISQQQYKCLTISM